MAKCNKEALCNECFMWFFLFSLLLSFKKEKIKHLTKIINRIWQTVLHNTALYLLTNFTNKMFLFIKSFIMKPKCVSCWLQQKRKIEKKCLSAAYALYQHCKTYLSFNPKLLMFFFNNNDYLKKLVLHIMYFWSTFQSLDIKIEVEFLFVAFENLLQLRQGLQHPISFQFPWYHLFR